jgi:hypothetical protein
MERSGVPLPWRACRRGTPGARCPLAGRCRRSGGFRRAAGALSSRHAVPFRWAARAVPGPWSTWAPAAGCGLRAAGCGLRAAGCGLRAAGCGLRQGEIFGLAVDNITDLGWLYVRQQVKKVDGPLVFAPPKRGKLRDVPLDPEVSAALRKHMARFPSVEATLPWLPPTGPRVTHPLVFTSGIGAAIWSRAFKDQAWKPAAASAGIQRVADQRLPGRRRPCHRACTRY